ncbi:MAG: hypothetical protein C0404_08730 [Verrucomicrobia bacterium]|nr:hypothetical protein [Verrucomicrobiota bacterium]
MPTQFEHALNGKITAEMEAAAASERVSASKIRSEIARGRAVLPCNPSHQSLEPCIAGRAFSTKVNANIGCSADTSSMAEELEKLQIAVNAGADLVMDLSVGSNASAVRREILDACTVPLGTVPIYDALSRVNGNRRRLTEKLLLQVIRQQAEEGVDFMTIHAGLLRKHVPLAMKRKMGIVSRGGTIVAEWMCHHRKENPFYTAWNEIMAICREHDVTVSLGDGLRPGCLADASDKAQFAELEVLGRLVARCRKAGVQVMVEGPGHVPFDQIKMNMDIEKKICDGAPFYVLGPVVTDIAPGYDHITSCIGATAAAYHGASLLCYVTPAEHLGLPLPEEVRAGVIAYKIAAHAADVARKIPGARDRDDAMAEARMSFNWNRQFELALDGETARARYNRTAPSHSTDKDYCSMCGKDFCAVRASKRLGGRNESKKGR